MKKTIVIAFGGSPSSFHVIDAGVLLAQAFEAHVVACSVRDSRLHEEESLDQLSLNARHASDLGAEVVHLEGQRVAKQLAQLSRERGADTIVIGRSPSSAFFPRLRKPISNQIQRAAHDIDILVVSPAEKTDQKKISPNLTRSISTTGSNFRRWVQVTLIMVTAVGLSMVVASRTGRDANTIMILLAGVLFSSALGTRVSGLLSSVFAVVSFNFFFTEPRFTLVVYDPGYLITFPVMFIVAFVTSELTSRLNTIAAVAQTRQRRAETLYRNGKQLLSARGVETIAAIVQENLKRLLQRQVDITIQNGTEAEIDTHSTHSTGTIVEIATENQRFGTISVADTTNPLTFGSVTLLNAISAQLAIALDRERLAMAEEHARLHAERERVRANLLRSVSHDLRTPLSVIAGSAQTLLDTTSLPEPQRQLLHDMETDAMWLSGIVENILSLTKIQDEMPALHTTEEVLEEVLLGSIQRVARRVQPDRFVVQLPTEIILVQMDISLLEQLFVNVLGNAIDFSPPDEPIDVRVSMDTEKHVVVVIRDRGPGIPLADIDHVFDLFYTGKRGEDSHRGMGIGLTIAKTVAELHGGVISLENANNHGLIATIRLPAQTFSSTGDRL